jgi:hypothetical protein
MAARNEADPFRALYEANRQRIWRLLARIAGPQEADDLTQVVFAKAAGALEARCDFYRNEDNELACEPKPVCATQRPTCSGTANPVCAPQDETV